MAITRHVATPSSLDELVEAVATWQHEGGPVQIHPGDLGWHWRLGADTLAQALRVWRRDDEIVAVGVADESVIRLALSPAVDQDEEFAARLVADLSDSPTVEARYGAALRALLDARGWTADEPWTPLRRDLTEPV